jgi:RNA polymerase sigma-70 factor (ECF subfamily)
MNKADDIYDEFLILRCQQRDVDALEILVTRWQKPLLDHATIVCGDRNAANDIVQNAWIAMIKGISRLKDPARFKHWAYRTVSNKSVDYIRRQNSQNKLSETAFRTEADPVPNQEDHQVIHHILSRMSRNHRTVLALHYLQGFEISEIASITRVPIGTVKSRLHHGREVFRELLEQADV